MTYLNLEALAATPVVREPFDYLIVQDFVRPDQAAAIGRDYPAIDKPGSFTLEDVNVGGALAGLIAAAGVLIFAVLTNRTFLSEGSAERFLGLPVLGSVPLRQPDYQRRLA